MTFKSMETWFKLAVVLAGLYLLQRVTSLYLPVLLSIVLTFILNPLVSWLCRQPLWPSKKRLGRGLAVLLSFVVSSMLVLLIMTFILAPFIGEFNNLIKSLPFLIKRVQSIVNSLANNNELAVLFNHLPTAVEQVMSSAAAYSLGLIRRVVNSTFGLAADVVQLIIVPVLTYYLLKDWHGIKDNLLSFFSAAARGKATMIVEEIGTVVSNYIRGQVMISIVIGIIVFGGMYAFDVEYPLVLGLLAALTESIPILGPVIGALPAVVLAYLLSPVLAAKVILFYVVIQQLENHILVPKIMGHVIDLHPVTIIISMLIGGQLLGIAGLILAVPVAAICKVLLNHLWISG